MTETYVTIDAIERLMAENDITWQSTPASISGRFNLTLDTSRYELARVDRLEVTTDAGSVAVESWWFDESPPEVRVFLPERGGVEVVRELAHVFSRLSDLVREGPDAQVELNDLVPVMVSYAMRGEVVPG